MFLFLQARHTPHETASPASALNSGAYHISSANDAITGWLQHRTAYPGTFCFTDESGTVHLGYGNPQGADDEEFLAIQITRQGEIRIERDVLCTLPLFFGYSNGTFVLCNEYKEVCAALPRLTPDRQAIARFLLDTMPGDPFTMWQEVGVLGEREVLTLNRRGLHVSKPSSRPWSFSDELPRSDPYAFPGLIAQHFHHFTDTKLEGNIVGFEISGGLDSAFLPLFLAASGRQLHAYAGSIIQPSAAANQLDKIAQVEAYTGLKSKKVLHDPTRHFPLIKHIDPRGNFIHIRRNPYEPAKSEIADFFAEQGVNIMVSGGGADQIMEHRPSPAVRPDIPPDDHHAFASQTARKLFSDYRPPAFSTPANLLPSGIFYENLVRTNMYLARGIWPVSPYYDIPLFNYLQGLPVQFRANKNIVRAYFEAKNFPLGVYRGPNEDFGDFFNDCWFSGQYEPFITELTEDSMTAAMGLVEIEIIRTILDDVRHGNRAVADQLYHLMNWMCLELNLRAANEHKLIGANT